MQCIFKLAAGICCRFCSTEPSGRIMRSNAVTEQCSVNTVDEQSIESKSSGHCMVHRRRFNTFASTECTASFKFIRHPQVGRTSSANRPASDCRVPSDISNILFHFLFSLQVVFRGNHNVDYNNLKLDRMTFTLQVPKPVPKPLHETHEAHELTWALRKQWVRRLCMCVHIDLVGSSRLQEDLRGSLNQSHTRL